MKRRPLLAATGTAAVTPIVGCLGDGGDPETTGEGTTPGTDSEGSPGSGEYEVCHFVSIDYESLPREIRTEVDAALEDGRYEAETLLFAEAIDPDRSFLVVDGTPYDPRVDTGGNRDGNEMRTLELRKVDAVTAPEPRVITVANDDTRDHEIHVELTGDETLVDETVTVPPGEEREIEATDRFGSYELTARARTGHEDADRFGFAVDDSSFDGHVSVTADGIFVTQSVADMLPCPWDVRYD